MKNFLRILTLLLIAAIACSLFACNKGGDEEPTDEVATDGFFEENRSYMTLDASVRIYNPKKWDKVIDSYAYRIADAIKQKSGLELEVVYESDGTAAEICVGYAIGHKASEAA